MLSVTVSRSTVKWGMKELATKIQVPCPYIAEMYNQGMGGIHLFDQRTAAYHLHHKSSIRFYQHIFFRIDGCSLCQCLHCLQYDASKRPYLA